MTHYCSKLLLFGSLVWMVGCGTSSPGVEQTHALAIASTIARRLTVEPGQFVELNVTMPASAKVVARFRSDGELAFNTHSHSGGKLVIHEKGSAASGTLQVVAKADEIFSFLWKNEGDVAVMVELDVALAGGASVHSWVPD